MKKDFFNKYVKAVASHFNFTIEEMFVQSKRRDIVDARQILYYLCMERPIRISYICRFLKEHNYNVGHSTIIHGYKEAKKLVESDPDYKNLVKNILKNNDFTTPLNYDSSKKIINNSTHNINISKEEAIKELKSLKELLDLDLINKNEFQKKAKDLKKVILD